MVSTAAAHANDAMKRIEKFKQLLDVQESLGGTVDLVSPTRELVKEGKIVKISARSGDHQDRYLFLVRYHTFISLCFRYVLLSSRQKVHSSKKPRFSSNVKQAKMQRIPRYAVRVSPLLLSPPL